MEENFWEEILKHLGIPHEIVLFLEIFENTVPFATGSCWKFKLEVMVEWKAPYKNIDKDSFGLLTPPPPPLPHPKHIIHTYFLVIVQIWAGILYKIVTWIITKLITSEYDTACKESYVW